MIYCFFRLVQSLIPIRYLVFLLAISLVFFDKPGSAQIMGDAVDVSSDFSISEQVYFFGDRLVDFDPVSGQGKLEWARFLRQLSLSFNKLDRGFARARSTDFPTSEYETELSNIYEQAKFSSAHGYPMLRTLFFEFPEDPTSWLIEDEYLFGSDLLVAPMFNEEAERLVYLPPGHWLNYLTGDIYSGSRWHRITAGRIPIVLLVKDHSALPVIRVAQSTSALYWSEIELRVFSSDGAGVAALFALPEGELRQLELEKKSTNFF